MDGELFLEFKNSLDRLVETPVPSCDQMREIEEILDLIQDEHGCLVYEGLNVCYEAALLSKQRENGTYSKYVEGLPGYEE